MGEDQRIYEEAKRAAQHAVREELEALHKEIYMLKRLTERLQQVLLLGDTDAGIQSIASIVREVKQDIEHLREESTKRSKELRVNFYAELNKVEKWMREREIEDKERRKFWYGVSVGLGLVIAGGGALGVRIVSLLSRILGELP